MNPYALTGLVMFLCAALLVLAKFGVPEVLRWIAAYLLSHAEAWEAHRMTRKASMCEWKERLRLTPHDPEDCMVPVEQMIRSRTEEIELLKGRHAER